MQRLRQETEADHQAAESALPLMHEGLDLSQYILCLRQLYGVVAAWEQGAREDAPAWMQATLHARQRLQLLERDLNFFGVVGRDSRRPALATFKDLPSLLGAMYVMEGSTLGGQLIARHVAASLTLHDGHGDAFFRGHGEGTGPMWKEFCVMLKTQVPDEQTGTVVVAAKAMFTSFGQWMSGNPVVSGS